MTTDPTSTSAGNYAYSKRNLDSVEQIVPGVTLEWLTNGRIAYFNVTTVERVAVDAWLNCSLGIVKSWPAEVPYLAIHNVSGSALTPYTRERSAQTVAMTPQYLHGRSAVVMPRTIFNQAIQLFVTINLARQKPNIQRRVFLDLDESIRWVLNYHKTEDR